MNLSTKISNILERRKQKVPSLERVVDDIRGLQKDISLFQSIIVESKDMPNDFLKTMQQVAESLSSNYSEIEKVKTEAERIAKRFGKSTINIAVGGKARQGKSTLLQCISGLDSKTIPTSDGSPCTGTKSTVLHSNELSKAMIEVFSEREFVNDIIGSQFKELGYPTSPSSLEEFEKTFPETDMMCDERRNLNRVKYDWLRKVHSNLIDLRRLLERQGPFDVSLDEVPSYVTQRDEKTGVEYNNYVVVKCANIYTRFPNHDVTGLGLVDLPGLEAAQAHDQKLVRSLEHEVDCVILVKLPSTKGAELETDDLQVMDLIQRSIGKGDLDDWLFVVLNELDDGNNKKQVDILKNVLSNEHNVKNVLCAACNDPESVETKVFLPLLSHIGDKLDRIDAKILSGWRSNAQNLIERIEKILAESHLFLEKREQGTSEDRAFRSEFKKFKIHYRGELIDLIKDKMNAEYLKEIDCDFEKHIDEVCNEARLIQNFLKSEDLDALYKDKGGWPGAIQETMHRLRSALTENLMSLDNFLENLTDDILKKILLEAIPDEVQRILKTRDEEQSPKRIVKTFKGLLTQEYFPKLTSALDFILDFEFSYKTHFHYRVRQEMGPIDPFVTTYFTKDFIGEETADELTAEETAADELTADDIFRGFEVVLKEVVYKVRQKLKHDMILDPGKAMFAFAEEIRDRLTRAEGIMDEWEDFLKQNRGDIWNEKFGAFAAEVAIRAKWQKTMDRTEDNLKKMHDNLQKIGVQQAPPT